jgi:hypothetical protein
MWADERAITNAGGLGAMTVAMGAHVGKLGTDHVPVFVRFSVRSQGEPANAEVPRGLTVHSAPPPEPRGVDLECSQNQRVYETPRRTRS